MNSPAPRRPGPVAILSGLSLSVILGAAVSLQIGAARGGQTGAAAIAGAVGLGYFVILLVQVGLLIAGHRRWLGVSIALLAIHTAVTYCSFYGVFIVLVAIHPGGVLCTYPPLSLGILLACTVVLLGADLRPAPPSEDDDLT